MPIVTLAEMKAELGVTIDADDDMITAKIAEAQAWVEAFLGFEIATEFPDGHPADLTTAVKMQTAWLYEQREAVGVGLSFALAPNGVADIVRNHRRYTFGAADAQG